MTKTVTCDFCGKAIFPNNPNGVSNLDCLKHLVDEHFTLKEDSQK